MLGQFAFDALPQNIPDTGVLYHYTHSQGLFGIVSSKVLWATQLQFLNDRKEFLHAIDVAGEVFTFLEKKRPPKKAEQYVWEGMKNRLHTLSEIHAFRLRPFP